MDTWPCHICGDERPDDKISVRKRTKSIGPVEFQENVRYCNDRDSCIAGAEDYHHVKGLDDNDSG